VLPDDAPEFVEVYPAARYCGCSANKIYKLIKDGTLEAHRDEPGHINRPWLISTESIRKYQNSLPERRKRKSEDGIDLKELGLL
jgi:excisionase family DNA binding protein